MQNGLNPINLLDSDQGLVGNRRHMPRATGMILPDLSDPGFWKEFTVPAKDHHGQSERYWGTMLPGMSSQVAMLIQSKQLPYRTAAELQRHAIWRHLKWLELIMEQLGGSGKLQSVSSQVDAMMEILKDEEFNMDFQTTMSKTQEVVNRLIGSGDQQEAERMLWQLWDQIEQMPRGYWHDRWEREFKQRFGFIIEKKGRIIDYDGR